MVDFMSEESKKTLNVLVEKERRILAELEYEDRKGGKAYMNQGIL